MSELELFGIDLYQNLAGYCKTKSENELYSLLEKIYFPNKFGINWENISNKSIFHNGYKPDYRAWLKNLVYYYEIKNEEFSIHDLLQVIKYMDFLGEYHGFNNFCLNTIAFCYNQRREELLGNLGINTFTIKEIVEPYLGGIK